MEDLTYINGIITFRGYDYPYESVEKIDDISVQISMGGQLVFFVGDQTAINGILMSTPNDIINTLNNG